MRLRLREIANGEGIRIDNDARDAIVKLSGGDMRKVLNILESSSMAHTDEVTEDDVYNTTGRPSPKEIEAIFQSLCADNFDKVNGLINDIKTKRSLTLEDIARDLHKTTM